MEPQFVKALFDIDFEWTDIPPAYRVYVNDELFGERTYVWHEQYLSEMLQILAVPGQYKIHIEQLNSESGKMRVWNQRIETGPAQWISDGILEIKNES
jgi:hypothetical protein